MRTRISPTYRATDRKVADTDQFLIYARQVLGVPWPTLRDEQIARKKINELFDKYPAADYKTLTKLVDWCWSSKRRVPRVWMIVDKHPEAFAAGVLPELSMSHEDVEAERGIRNALAVETDPKWRAQLMSARGLGRKEAIRAWKTNRLPQLPT